MSGWDVVRRLTLPEPWSDFWVDLYEDPPMGSWLKVQSAAIAAIANRSPETIDAAITAFRPLIAAHNITDRDGQPLELKLESMPSSLFQAMLLVIRRALDGEGLPPTPARKARSRRPSSLKTKFLPTTSSGA
jgi:hypothetical protein